MFMMAVDLSIFGVGCIWFLSASLKFLSIRAYVARDLKGVEV